MDQAQNFPKQITGHGDFCHLARSKGRKRALAAIARKLAVILHRMWIDCTAFSFTKPEAAS